MIPFTASDLIRLVSAEAQSALQNAPVIPEREAGRTSARFVRVRLGLGAALRWLADRVEPRRPAVPAPAGGRHG
jgi:hypothetical protein